MLNPTCFASFLPLLVVGSVALILPGCGEGEPASRVDRYEVTGNVLAVLTTGEGHDRVLLQHAPIPEFRRPEDGEVVGMPAMDMWFPLAEGLPVPEEGEALSFTLLVDGVDRGGLPYVIERLEADPEAGPSGRGGSAPASDGP